MHYKILIIFFIIADYDEGGVRDTFFLIFLF